MPSTSLKESLRNNDAAIYTNIITNVPADKEKGATFKVEDGFRTPQYVAGATDAYMNPLNIEKNNMDYVASFATDAINKINKLSKVLDPNGKKGLVAEQNSENSTGKFSKNLLAGSIVVDGADGNSYRINVQQRNIANEAHPYKPSKHGIEIYGEDTHPNKGRPVKTFGAQISVDKFNPETKDYDKSMGSVLLWGQMDRNGTLVPAETNRDGATVNNHFLLASDHNKNAFLLLSNLIKDNFSYTTEQLQMEKENPEMKENAKNMTFRVIDKDVAQDIKNTFVKTAEEVTKGTSRAFKNVDEQGKTIGKSYFVGATLDNVRGGDAAVILTPQVWVSDGHALDYSKHAAKVEAGGQRDAKEFGQNLNKAISEYTTAKGQEVAVKSADKAVALEANTKIKGKDIDY